MIVMWSILFSLAAAAQEPQEGAVDVREKAIVSFDEGTIPDNLVLHSVEVRLVPQARGRALHVDFSRTDWPNIFFEAGEKPWDWSDYVGIRIDLYNPEAEPINVCTRVDNAGADGATNCNTGSTTAQPGAWTTLQMYFNTGDAGPFWGMRGVPVRGPRPSGPVIDLTRITAFQVFLPRPLRDHSLIVDNIRLFGRGGDLGKQVPLPFVDRFGQYKHADWPGKLKTEEQLAERRQSEVRELKAMPALAGRDEYGGWADGPQREATGWFRTEKINGKWWLITPSGHLFFSNGVDCVGTWQRTFVEKREHWFDWLPDKEGPFKGVYGYSKGAHSMAEPINGEGATFGFYSANLIRKYGEEWPRLWRETSYARLRSWGFNTVANWSQRDVLENSPLPFVGSLHVHGNIRRIEGGGGYWAKMIDVYDASFAEAADKCVAAGVGPFAGNKLCIGYFADNEMAWEAVERGTLNSPPDQPCRVAFVNKLKAKYGDLEKLNKAWGIEAKSWDDLRVPGHVNAACREDLDDFVYTFGRKYFQTVQDAIKKHAPHHLYLGCRFSSRPKQVVRACADVADVVSFNLYYGAINAEDWTGGKDLGKPLVIGEFHFGALDRGMFHTGLVPTPSQEERAKAYVRYVRSVADCPAFVGCHWFQYVDEPITGRWFDGENYNIGFVNVTDTPYPEMVEAARKVHAEVYERRWAGGRQ